VGSQSPRDSDITPNRDWLWRGGDRTVPRGLRRHRGVRHSSERRQVAAGHASALPVADLASVHAEQLCRAGSGSARESGAARAAPPGGAAGARRAPRRTGCRPGASGTRPNAAASAGRERVVGRDRPAAQRSRRSGSHRLAQQARCGRSRALRVAVGAAARRAAISARRPPTPRLPGAGGPERRRSARGQRVMSRRPEPPHLAGSRTPAGRAQGAPRPESRAACRSVTTVLPQRTAVGESWSCRRAYSVAETSPNPR
jgi:hypothetical protein